MRTVFYDVSYLCQQGNRAEMGKVTMVRIEKGVHGADEMLADSWRMKATNISRDQQSFEEGIKKNQEQPLKPEQVALWKESSPVEQRGACGHWDRSLSDKAAFRERFFLEDVQSPEVLLYSAGEPTGSGWPRSTHMHVPFRWVWCLRQEPDVCNLAASVRKSFENITGLREGHVPFGGRGDSAQKGLLSVLRTLSLPTALSEGWYLICPIS